MCSIKWALLGIPIVASACAIAPVGIQSSCAATDPNPVETSAIAKMRSLEGGLDMDTPIEDARKNFLHNDFRFLKVMSGWGTEVPGVPDAGAATICMYGTRFVEGSAGDSFESAAHADLDIKVKHYVKKYNSHMLKLLTDLKAQ